MTPTQLRLLLFWGLHPDEIVDIEWVDNGPGWVGVLVENHETVLSLKPDIGRYHGDGQIDIGVVGPHPDDADVDFEVRAFFSTDRGQLIEDPVTGSLNASLAQWLIGSGRASRFVCRRAGNRHREGRPYPHHPGRIRNLGRRVDRHRRNRRDRLKARADIKVCTPRFRQAQSVPFRSGCLARRRGR